MRPFLRTAIVGLVGLAVVTPPGSVRAREAFEGVWARSDRECRDEEGPNSRLLIDLMAKGGPLADRYEQHCRILDRTGSAQGVRVVLRCHEFWEEYEKDQNGATRVEVWSPKGATRMVVNGKAFVRCIR